MPFEYISIGNYQNLGKKMIRLARGLDPRPKTLRDLKIYLNEPVSESADVVFPAYYDENAPVEYAQPAAKSELVVNLPHPDLLDDAEQSIQAGPAEYELPNFYADILFPCPPRNDLTQDERKAVFEMRIGDYTMASCK